MARSDPALATPLQYRMGGDQFAILQDVDRIGGNLHLDDTPAGAVGHGVEIAGDRDHAVAGDPALQRQHGVEGTGRERLEVAAFLGEMLDDNALGGGMQASIGDLVQPLDELGVQVVEIAEGAGEEEVLPHIAEGPLHLALGLGPVGLAGLGHETVMRRQIEEFGIVGDPLAGWSGSSTSPSTAVFMRSYRICAGTPPNASKAAIWQRSTVGRSWRSTKRAHIRRLWPSTIENSQTIRSTSGWSVNVVRKKAKSTWACLPGGVSNRRSNGTCGLGPDGAQEILQHGIAARIAERLDVPEQAAAAEFGKGRRRSRR